MEKWLASFSQMKPVSGPYKCQIAMLNCWNGYKRIQIQP